ncbi:MAG: hypothetical protein AAF330_02740, partial [Pseudomonadota bacterium]
MATASALPLGSAGTSLRRNVILSALEALVAGLGLFVIYRHVVAELGLAMLGVWSVLLATTALGRLADAGIASCLFRFVSRWMALHDAAISALYIRTALTTVGLGMAFATLPLWFGFSQFLQIVLSGAELELARTLLPIALLSLWLISIKSVLDSALLGLHRADAKSLAAIVGMGVQVWLSLLLVRDWGLWGLAAAQAAQFALASTICVVVLWRGGVF